MAKQFKTSLFDDCGNWWLASSCSDFDQHYWHGQCKGCAECAVDTTDRMHLVAFEMHLSGFRQDISAIQITGRICTYIHCTMVTWLIEIRRSSRFSSRGLSYRCMPAQFLFGCLDRCHHASQHKYQDTCLSKSSSVFLWWYFTTVHALRVVYLKHD